MKRAIRSDYMYCQCKLIKGDTITVSFIPEKFAKKGKYIKLKKDGVWDNGWLVEEAGVPMDGKFIEDRSRDWKNQRKQSDIESGSWVHE